MANNETAHELILQILKTRMTFRQTIQRVLRTNNVDMTFEMLQVMHLMEETRSQPAISGRTDS